MSPRPQEAAGPDAGRVDPPRRHAGQHPDRRAGRLRRRRREAAEAPRCTRATRRLDPQLVWKGKDEQDLAEYLAVPTVPVYIQEKVDPRALVENLRQTAAGGGATSRS